MSADWQISAGLLFELARPALFALSALASAWVLFDSRPCLGAPAVALWTLSTLVLPHIALPLYLIARIYSRRTSTQNATPGEATTDTTNHTTDASEHAPEAAEATDNVVAPRAKRRLILLARRFALPSLYAAALLVCGAPFYYADYRSTDARLARARQARIDGRRESALDEYRAAVRQSDDPHVRKILGLELSKAGRWEEALAELRAAERGGEPDDALAFHVATALAALDRPAEAHAEYRKFLQSPLCAQTPPDWRCEGVRAGVAP